MKYETFVYKFLEEFPEYVEGYKEHVEYNDELLPHVFFGDVLNEDLLKLLKKNSDPKKLKSLFEFMETMATDEDIDIQGVLSATILERIGDFPEIVKIASHYMGERTKVAFIKGEIFWGRDDNIKNL